MKKKDVISIIIITLTVAALIGGCLYLANRHRLNGKNDTSFFSYFVMNGKLMEYGLQDENVSKVCGHNGFDDECPLENVLGSVRVYENKVYFLRENKDAHTISYYDPKTKKIRDIVNVKNEVIYDISNNFAVGGGYVYYNEDGDILRVPVSGGNSELIYRSDGKLEILIEAAAGKLFTVTYLSPSYSSLSFSYTAQFFVYDLETLEKKEIFSTKSPLFSCLRQYQYYNGYIYMAVTKNIEEEKQYGVTHLYRLDPETEKIELILDTDILDFVISYGKIYYFPYESRTIGSNSSFFVGLCGESIFECSLDGKNSKAVYTNPDLIYETRHIFGSKFFGFCSGSCPELGIDSGQFYCTVDFNTGSIKKIEIPD